MVHYFIGNLGHFLVITSFITSIIAAYSYFLATNKKDELEKAKWNTTAKIIFYVHGIAVIGIVFSLYWIINNNYFEYHYAQSHSSKILPWYYQISCFWEGQEGSFLLWIFWNVILGVVLINTNKFWTAPVMTVFALVQAFLTSMILGVVLFNFKLGSSPFILLRDVIDAPIFKMNPEFVPKDGNGLNPLLQNYWMVIHPPTLFLGFATTLVPFAYCIAGLFIGKFKEWIRPALPWAQFSALVLGVGILMGAYWAYETLNFGGYWNWDPVENAVYVPWLVLVAAIHTMIAFKKSDTALKSAIILVISTFVLILYSTFLTRSGILGDSSVHSFTDLGLSGQLLIYLLVFVALSIWLTVSRWSKIPTNKQEVSTYSREFWILLGAITLCIMAFHVIYVTSYPVYNKVADLLGFSLNLAPPVDQVSSYSDKQIWFAIVVAVLSGTGQFFWWKKMDKKELKNALVGPLLISLVISFIIIFATDFFTAAPDEEGFDRAFRFLRYFLLLICSVYSIVANTKIIIPLFKSNAMLTGGSFTHIGVGMMLVGILFSSGYSKIVSENYTGLVWSTEFPEEVNRNNLLLFMNDPRQMGEYSLNYRGMRKLFKDKGYVNESLISNTSEPLKYVALTDIPSKKIKSGDTLDVIGPENTYFEIEYQEGDDKNFTLYPRVQLNETMDMIVYSPDIKRTLGSDLYTHIRTFPDPKDEGEWSELKEITAVMNSQFFVNDYVAVFEGVERLEEIAGTKLEGNDVAVKAKVRVQGETGDYIAEPIYIIKDQMAGKIPFTIKDLGIKITIESINPKENSFVFGIKTTQKEWVILEAVEMPYINILWFGTFLLCIGFTIAIRRRYLEFQKMRDKGVE